MAYTRLSRWLSLALFLFNFLTTEGGLVDITYLQNAVAKGAVCLDGSPPAYHFQKGFGEGINSWMIYLSGGAWCENVTACLKRKNLPLGSSKLMEKQFNFTGIMSNQQELNPYFYNWNIIRVRYCDGSSFTGDVEAVDPATNLHFRGARIWHAVMEDLLAKGMKNAENAILAGCSAGGLTTLLYCDEFKALFPNTTKVKCVADAGFFIDAEDIRGERTIETIYSQIVETHGSAKNLPKSCTSERKPELCLFPQYVIQHVQTPIYIINSPYDQWQVMNILVPGTADPHGNWLPCKQDVRNCSSDQIETMQQFRSKFLDALGGLLEKNSESNGMFIDSCYEHCHIDKQETWFRNDSTVVSNKKLADEVGDWFYDDKYQPLQKPDCPYPCNPTCHNVVTNFTQWM
ncbi:pectin acetylesterase 8-like [Ziziphus jujuba]|uniref:Pectin acetylesterase n=1 Tax=Ziziphus jujuba TaxID=326968 RepID=A0A6P4ABW9_ZIZJJ|nr:pectin acetylesterase 8-like [Ziziphus jujuba]